jgi:hypothetical protein
VDLSVDARILEAVRAHTMGERHLLHPLVCFVVCTTAPGAITDSRLLRNALQWPVLPAGDDTSGLTAALRAQVAALVPLWTTNADAIDAFVRSAIAAVRAGVAAAASIPADGRSLPGPPFSIGMVQRVLDALIAARRDEPLGADVSVQVLCAAALAEACSGLAPVDAWRTCALAVAKAVGPACAFAAMAAAPAFDPDVLFFTMAPDTRPRRLAQAVEVPAEAASAQSGMSMLDLVRVTLERRKDLLALEERQGPPPLVPLWVPSAAAAAGWVRSLAGRRADSLVLYPEFVATVCRMAQGLFKLRGGVLLLTPPDSGGLTAAGLCATALRAKLLLAAGNDALEMLQHAAVRSGRDGKDTVLAVSAHDLCRSPDLSQRCFRWYWRPVASWLCWACRRCPSL